MLSVTSASALTLTGNVTCSIANLSGSTACEGAFVGNDANQNLDGLFSITGWTEINKVDSDSGTDGDLTVTGGGTSGGWSFDYGINDPVMFVLKGGNSFSAYLMDLSVTSGTWNTDGIEKGNGQPNPGLSHFAVYSGGTNGGGNPPPNPIPLPAAGWLLISGVAGLGFFGRRKAKS